MSDTQPTASLVSDWQILAACREWSESIFFYEEVIRKEPWRAVLPKVICSRCPVRRECLTYALECEQGGLSFGIWGGLTPEERHPKDLKHLAIDQRVDLLIGA